MQRFVIGFLATLILTACESESPEGPLASIDIGPWQYRDGLEPVANAEDFDDSDWETIDDIGKPRGGGGNTYGWYRHLLTVPDEIDGVAVSGQSLRFVTIGDDYAEVHIDGAFKQKFDQNAPLNDPKNNRMGYEIAGFNKANVVDLGVCNPGDEIQIAVLVVNGPIAAPIGGHFLRFARLEVIP